MHFADEAVLYSRQRHEEKVARRTRGRLACGIGFSGESAIVSVCLGLGLNYLRRGEVCGMGELRCMAAWMVTLSLFRSGVCNAFRHGSVLKWFSLSVLREFIKYFSWQSSVDRFLNAILPHFKKT